MSIVAPKGRKHLSADALFGLVRSGIATIPDDRLGDTEISWTDGLMSAFALFSRQSPSRLAFAKERTAGNLETIDGIEHVPGDTYRREILEAVAPEWRRPLFTSIFRQRQRGKALEAMAFGDGSSWVALDGTGYVSSTTIHGASCLQTVHRHGSVTYAQQMLGAALIHPDVRAVMPLRPAPIVKHDGADHNDCERHAAQRLVAKLRQEHPHLQGLVTEDRLRSNAPHIATLHADDLHDILGVKDGDHALLCPQVQAAEHTGRVTYDERHDRAAGLRPRGRLVHDVPLHEANAEVRVHFIAYWESGDDQVQPFSWVTDLRVRKRNVLRLRRGGRARWKIAHETFNTLKHPGYHFEHHDGHGTQPLAVVFAVLMMLACLVDQTPQRGCAWFQAVWSTLGSKRWLWERMRALFYAEALESMRHLLEALLDGLKKPTPSFASDSSERAIDSRCDRRPSNQPISPPVGGSYAYRTR